MIKNENMILLNKMKNISTGKQVSQSAITPPSVIFLLRLALENFELTIDFSDCRVPMGSMC